MSYRKTKLIQERNILLERKYILEQGPVPPPPPPPAPGTPPPPAPPAPAPSTPPPSSGGTKTFEIKSVEDFKDDKYKNSKCSTKTMPEEIEKQTPKTISGDSKKFQYYLTKDNSQLFCYDEIEDKK
jgi:hypothetical protein